MADRIDIAATQSSPSVTCDPATRTIVLSGESYPENTFDFYRPLLAWMEEVIEADSNTPFVLDVALSYLNTGSIKSMMDMLDRLDEAHGDGIAVSVVWRCDSENERIIELAEELMEDVDLPHEIRSE